MGEFPRPADGRRPFTPEFKRNAETPADLDALGPEATKVILA
jgi:hypothetical protein